MPRDILEDMIAAGANKDIIAQIREQLAPPAPEPAPAPAVRYLDRPGTLTTSHPAMAAAKLSALRYGEAQVKYDSLNGQIAIKLEAGLWFVVEVTHSPMTFRYRVGKRDGPRHEASPLSAAEEAALIEASKGFSIR